MSDVFIYAYGQFLPYAFKNSKVCLNEDRVFSLQKKTVKISKILLTIVFQMDDIDHMK